MSRPLWDLGTCCASETSTPRLCSETLQADTGAQIYGSPNGNRIPRWPVDNRWFWCNDRGAPVAGTAQWPSRVGAQAGASVILVTDKGLQSFARS